jgi:hypothetical protein
MGDNITMRKNKQPFSESCILTESDNFSVDVNKGIIQNVKLVGFNSKNNRVYSRKCLEDALKLYEGAPVNANHVDSDKEVSIYDRLGKIQNVKMTDQGVFGDFHFLKSHPMAERVLEAADKMPELFGFSHRAQGTVKSNKSGPEEVSKINNVLSVDLVSDPATTRSLHEAISNQGDNKMDDKEKEVEKDTMQEEYDDMKKKMSDMKDVCEAEDMSPEDKLKKLHDLLGVDMDEEEDEKDDEEKSDEKKESVKHNTNNNKINAKLLLEAAGLNNDDDLVRDLEKLDVESASKMVRRLAESKFKAATKNFIPSKQDNKMSSNDLARFLLS